MEARDHGFDLSLSNTIRSDALMTTKSIVKV